MNKKFDYIILGAGIYGLYAAKLLGEKKMRVAVVDCDAKPFSRASFVNQARVHNGYHYPRSFSTAIKSAGYFERFVRDFDFAINSAFTKIYAISKAFSLSSGAEFKRFCGNAKIACEEISPKKYFEGGLVEQAFETREYALDAIKIRDWFVEKISAFDNVSFYYNYNLESAEVENDAYRLKFASGEEFAAHNVLNASYASINQLIDIFGFEKFKIKYEICEIILCGVSDAIKNTGITVMDGPFFSVMPFGLGGSHSLSAVTFTPHMTSNDFLPRFICQSVNKTCTPAHLQNCNSCPARPETAWPHMNQLAKKYLLPSINLKYERSLFAIKPILKVSEIDDSRPTLIKKFSGTPGFISVLSGKINTIYDLDGELT